MIEIIKIIFEEVVPFTVGTYCLYITGVFLDLIRQRFRHLNETIIPFVSQSPVTGSSGEITIYDVRCLHCVLIDSANLINRLYGIGSLITSFSILIEFVACIYGFAIDGIGDNEIVAMLDLLFQAFYLYTMYHFATYEVNIKRFAVKYFLKMFNKLTFPWK